MRDDMIWVVAAIFLLVLGCFFICGYEENEKKNIQSNLTLFDTFTTNGESFNCSDVENISVDAHTYTGTDVVFYLKNGDRVYTSINRIIWHNKED